MGLKNNSVLMTSDVWKCSLRQCTDKFEQRVILPYHFEIFSVKKKNGQVANWYSCVRFFPKIDIGQDKEC